MKGMNFTKVHVTPRMAKDWLLKNYANRPITNARVEYYLKQMKAGSWHGENDTRPIAITQDGNLIDGQHRLTALVRYNKPLMMWVAKNCPEESRLVIDKGANRTLANTLYMEYEITNASRIAAISRLLQVYDGNTQKLDRMSVDEVLKTIGTYHEQFDWYTKAQKHKRLSQATVFAPLVWVHKKYPEKVESFADGLATGEGLLEGSPILKLREMYLMNQMRASQYQQLLQSCYTFSALRTHVGLDCRVSKQGA